MSARCGIPQSKIKDFCQLPLAREPFCARYRFIVRYRALSDFQSTAWEGGSPKTNKPKRGQKLKRSTRAKAKGQSRMVPPGGFSRGEQFERERVVPPLSRLLCLLSCRSKKVRPRRAVPAANFARWLSTIRHFPDPPGIVLWCDAGLSHTINRQRGTGKPLECVGYNEGRD